MTGMPIADLTARRARWLAELGQALEQARRVLHQLAMEESRLDAAELFARIESASREVERLRIRRSAGGGQDFGPEWIKDIPWRLSA